MRELDTKLTALPDGEELFVKLQLVKVAVLVTSSASSGTKLSCTSHNYKCGSHINFTVGS